MRDRVRAGAADLLAEQAGDDRADERRERHDGEVARARASSPSLSPSAGRARRRRSCERVRNRTTRIARPIADSAAATVRMKNTNTCPAMSSEVVREGDEVEVDGEQHQLDRHQQHDQVLAVEEDADHRQREQDRAERQVVAERRRGRGSSPLAGGRHPARPCRSARVVAARCARRLDVIVHDAHAVGLLAP